MKRMMFPLLLSLAISVCATATNYYVWPGGRGLKTGLSWADASGDLQAMINTADSADQIWIARGVYKPDRPADDLLIVDPGNRKNAFVLKANVRMYGGFSGSETSLTARDSLTQETILSGDFNGDDVATGAGAGLAFSGIGENAYHVVIAAGYMGDAVLDGCRVTGGNSNGSGATTVNGIPVYHDRGAGIYCNQARLTMANCAITQNKAASFGGGLYSAYSPAQHMQRCTLLNNQADTSGGGIAAYMGKAPVLSECAVSGNRALANGGGVFFCFTDSSSALLNCIIRNNDAAYGGGLYQISGGNSMTNCLVEANTASSQGGGVYSTGATSYTYRDCSFKNNKALSGGGFYYYASSAFIYTNMIHCTFSRNTAQVAGGGIYTASGSLNIKKSAIIEDTASYGAGICAFNSFNFLTDCSISRNIADSAAAMHGSGSSMTGIIHLANCTVAGNNSVSGDCIGAGANGNVRIFNTVVWGNNGGLAVSSSGNVDQSYSLVQGEPGGTHHNISGAVDPLFINLAGGDYRLQAGSH